SHSNIPRNVRRLVSTRRPPPRRSASACQCSHTHTLRSSNATATYSSRSSGSRVLVLIRACPSCRYVASIANRLRYVSFTHGCAGRLRPPPWAPPSPSRPPFPPPPRSLRHLTPPPPAARRFLPSVSV